VGDCCNVLFIVISAAASNEQLLVGVV